MNTRSRSRTQQVTPTGSASPPLPVAAARRTRGRTVRQPRGRRRTILPASTPTQPLPTQEESERRNRSPTPVVRFEGQQVTMSRDEYSRLMDLMDRYQVGVPDIPTPQPSPVRIETSAVEPTNPVRTGELSAYQPLFYDPRFQVQVPKFNGKPEDFLAWKHRFVHTIAIRPDTPEAKYLYLLDAVEQVSSVQHFRLWTPNQQSFDAAMAKLDSIFGRPTTVIDNLLKRFRGLKAVLDEDNTESILEILSSFEALIQTAQNLERLPMYEDAFRRAIFAKLPRRYMDSVFRQIQSDQPPLHDILRISDEKVQTTIRSSRWRIRKDFGDFRAKKEQTSRLPSYTLTPVVTCLYDRLSHSTELCPLNPAQKMEIVTSRGLCLLCLQPGHRKADCKQDVQCTKCRRRHHTSLCGNTFRVGLRPGPRALTSIVTPADEGSSATTNPSNPQLNLGNISDNTAILFKTFWFQTDTRFEGRGFIDEGASVNCITESEVTRLRLKPFMGPAISLVGFGQTSAPSYSQYTRMTFRGGFKNFVTMTFLIVPSITSHRYPTSPSNVTQLVPIEYRTHYRDSPGQQISMLIAISDFGPLAGPVITIHNSDSHSYAYQTWTCGTLIFGGVRDPTKARLPISLIFSPEDLVAEVNMADVDTPCDFVESFLRDHVRKVEGRIEVDVPITGYFQLENNYGKVLRQMRGNVARWTKSKLIEPVRQILLEWKNSGIIEPVTHDDRNDPYEHFLSYHVVIKLTSTTTKHRIVFNGSLPDRYGRSLNDFLFKGSTKWSIVKSLFEFRRFQFPLVGDLRQAFLMVQLSKFFRNMFRFFWPHSNLIEIYRFVRVPFGTSASPFLLFIAICKIIELERLDNPEIADLLQKFYVDDLVCSFPTAMTREQCKQKCIAIFGLYGFQFGWTEQVETTVLGIQWNSADDQLAIKLPERRNIQTVRDLASFIPSIFDPLGFLEPIVAQFRRIFSAVWKRTPDWHGCIEDEQRAEIDSLVRYLYDHSIFSIPRFTDSSTTENQIVHVFADANPTSLGVAFYGLNPTTQRLHLMFAKSILKGQRSIAELELDAIVLASLLITKHLNPAYHRIILWTDSQLNFHRISVHSVNQLNFRQAMKVINIRNRLHNFDATIRHVAGKRNPADQLTKFSTKHFSWQRWIEMEVPTEFHESHIHYTLLHTVDPQTTVHDPLQDTMEDIETSDDLQSLLKKYDISDLIKTVQRKAWGPEIDALRLGKPLSRKSSLGQFYYEMIDGILHTRLRTDSKSSRIMIPATSHLLKLIWQAEHLKHGHMAAKSLKTKYLSVYFTHGVLPLFLRWSHLCNYCALTKRRPLRPVHAPLTEERCHVPPRAFSHIGLDFAGPMRTADGDRYILLITCFHTRAVLLFLLAEQNSHAIRCVLRKFVARFNEPISVYSDNATVFVRTDKVIKQLYKDLQKIQADFRWKYSFPGDPQSNGVTEVMIGMVKRTLKGFELPRVFSSLELDTYLAEAEMVINNRPLFMDKDELITPNHGIYGDARHTMLQPLTRVGTLNSEHIHVQIRKKVRTFWNRWYEGYRDNIRPLQLGANGETLHVGDRVLYRNGSIDKDGQYPTGTVSMVYPGQDGIVRLVDLRMDDQSVLTRRPTRTLIRFSSQGPEVVATESCN